MRKARYSYLPDELIFDIFLKLPAKSLIRFRSLSKSWKACITDSTFIVKHHSVAKERFSRGRPSFLLIEKLDGSESIRKITFKIDTARMSKLRSFESRVVQLRRRRENTDDDLWFKEIGYSSGIFCLYGKYGDALLWNPATKNLKMVGFRRISGAEDIQGFGFGFGQNFHNVAVDIKMVWLVRIRCSQGWRCRFQIYTLNTDSWHWGKSSIAANGFGKTAGAEINGVLHWIGKEAKNDALFILTFDLNTETCGRIELPPYLNLPKKQELRASLDVESQLLVILAEGRTLWIMQKYGAKESWVRVILTKPRITKVLGYCDLIDMKFFQTSSEQELKIGLIPLNKSYKYNYGPAGSPRNLSMFNYVENLMPIKGCSWQQDLLRKYSE